jgi:hypothetical protein
MPAMSDLISSSELAAQLLGQITEIERRIASLIEFRDGLKRAFVGVNKGDLKVPGDVPLNSCNRVLIEGMILDLLESADGRPLQTRELFSGTLSVSAHLKYTTFRSHLHRLKKRGLISAEDRTYGSWRLTSNSVNVWDNSTRAFQPSVQE